VSLSMTVHGIVPPLVTPLTRDGRLDADGLNSLTEHAIGGGVHGLFVLGTTGEGPLLAQELRREVTRLVCQRAESKVPVLVGAIETSYAEALILAQFAGDQGAHSVVVAPPYYQALSTEDAFRFVERLAEESPIPVFLYNVPNARLPRFDMATLERAAKLPNVAGFKDSSGDAGFLRESIPRLKAIRREFSMLVGPEGLLSEAIRLGGDGGVSGGANLFPEIYVALYDACVAGDEVEAVRLQGIVDDVNRLIYTIGDSASSLVRGLKGALRLRGICADGMAWPYLPPTDVELAEIQRRLLHFEG
jgi:dihydrodipicolinate synthase/N-acetylneuraminate lyase